MADNDNDELKVVLAPVADMFVKTFVKSRLRPEVSHVLTPDKLYMPKGIVANMVTVKRNNDNDSFTIDIFIDKPKLFGSGPVIKHLHIPDNETLDLPSVSATVYRWVSLFYICDGCGVPSTSYPPNFPTVVDQLRYCVACSFHLENNKTTDICCICQQELICPYQVPCIMCNTYFHRHCLIKYCNGVNKSCPHCKCESIDTK